MRIIALCCLFLVCLLNIVPCADEQPVSLAAGFSLRTPAQQQDYTLSVDHCSPFCNCSCCATSSIAKIMILNSIPAREYQIPIPAYLAGTDFGISRPVWQPPQII